MVFSSPFFRHFPFRLSFSFDTTLKKWQVLEPMEVANFNLSAVALNDYIVVAGGGLQFHSQEVSVLRYDPVEDKWMQLASMIYPQYNFGLVKYEGFLFAVGGNEYGVIESYDHRIDRWVRGSKVE